MSYLPSDYTPPKTGGRYMKFTQGVNTFRVLSPVVMGYEYWNTEKKPVRSKQAPLTRPNDIRMNEDGSDSSIDHFWAFIVWNYDTQDVNILQVKQMGIICTLTEYIQNPSWGDPRAYDISVKREGSGFNDTKYTVTVNPPKPLDEEIKKEADKAKINLEELFTGGDPFNSKEEMKKAEEKANADFDSLIATASEQDIPF